VTGAAAGAVAVVLFAVGSAILGERPGLDAPAGEVVAFFAERRARIHVGLAFYAVAAPMLVWFLVTVAILARRAGRDAIGAFAAACGAIFVTLLLVDLTALAVAPLRATSPEVLLALRDLEYLAMGMVAPVVVAMLAGFAVLAARHGAVWPPWVGRLAALAAALYALRTATLFTTEGMLSGSGLLGLYLPVTALSVWTLVASLVLVLHRAPTGTEA
jgi:hypothetical protein